MGEKLYDGTRLRIDAAAAAMSEVMAHVNLGGWGVKVERALAGLRAVQSNTAHCVAAPQQRYRLLVPEVDRIEAGDEFLSEDAQTWAVDPNAIFAGMIFGGRVLRPARRAVTN